MSCCTPKVEYVGSIFYKVIDDHMEKTGKPELDEVFAKADDPLQQAEITRKKIATAFKAMTIVTGTCVLRTPDLEQCIRAYVIRFLMELRINAPTQGGSIDLDVSKMELNQLFSFTQSPPYFSFDDEKLKNLQSLFKINPLEGELGQMKDVIIEFLKTLQNIKQVYEQYAKEIGEIKQEGYEFVSKLDPKDGVSELYRQCMIGKRNLQKILDMRAVLQMIGQIGNEIAEAVTVFGAAYKDKTVFQSYDSLAQRMVEQKITDMKEIVWNTTNERKLDKFEDWRNNFEYKESGTLENN